MANLVQITKISGLIDTPPRTQKFTKYLLPRDCNNYIVLVQND